MGSCGCDGCVGAGNDPAGVALGDQLADWLDQLDLGTHLAEAGLPTYLRDEGGHARWTDPATGKAMTTAQLEALDRQLHSEGDDPAHAVPLPLVQLARRRRVRAELLDDDWLDYAGLAHLRGASLNATRFAVHKAAAAHELLLVGHDDQVLVPAFQLDQQGAVRTELRPVLRPLLAAGMEPWDAWAWLARPAMLLGGEVPQEVAADPDEAAIVAHAAVRLAERIVSS